MKFIFTKLELHHQLIKEYKKIFLDGYYLYLSDCLNYNENETHSSVILGKIYDFKYAPNDFENQSKSIHFHIETTWPLPTHISGSFSMFQFNKKTRTIQLATDFIASYPLYYQFTESNILISNSVSLVSSLAKLEIDKTGLAQAALGYGNFNLGSRTIAKGLKRILPGEKITLNIGNHDVKKEYASSLFQDISLQNEKITKEKLKNYWLTFKREMEYQLNSKVEKEKYIALSGGMDSRILLGAVDEEEPLKSFSYGPKDAYEVKIAQQLAQNRNISHFQINNYENYFPPREIIEQYQTEAVGQMCWIDVLEGHSWPSNKPLLLIGDLTESLPARNIKSHTSRDFRVKNYLRTNIFKRSFSFETNNDETFSAWKKNIIQLYTKPFTYASLKKLNLEINASQIIEETIKDLEELFQLIVNHKLPYTNLATELFNWFTYSRYAFQHQVVMCNAKFEAICPPISMEILRITSNIHPNLRLNYRFINKLFKYIPELKNLNTVPTAQTPWLPRYMPSSLVFLMWGIRSKIDQVLIKEILRSKEKKKPYRLVKSFNWFTAYQNKNLEKQIEGYFSSNQLGEAIKQDVLTKAMQRQNLTQWPLSNKDIMLVSAFNVQLAYIDENIKK